MASEFETIILQEDLSPTIKLEPFTSYDDDQNENNSNENYSTAAAEAKIEFTLLVQFTAHVQQHLHEIYTESINTELKSTDELIDVKPLLLDCIAEPLNETAIQFDDDDDDWEPSKRKRKNKKNKNQIKCADCDKYFEQPCLLRRHREVEHEGKMYRCNICKIEMSRKSNILRHLKVFHPSSDAHDSITIFFINENCAQPDDLKFELKKKVGAAHRRNKSGVFECPACDKYFTASYQLRQHCNMEHDRKAYRCQICDKRFETRPNMVKHLKNHHPNDDANAFVAYERPLKVKPKKNKLGLFECTDCSETFKLFFELRRHCDLTHDGKKFCCEICGLKASYKGNMYRHIKKIHPNQSKYSFIETYDTELTNDATNISQAPAANRDVQLNEKIDEQPIEQRTNPIRIKRKFKCQKCKKSFKSKLVLTQHQVVHSIEKKFVCRICANRFAYRKVLESHMKNKHPATELGTVAGASNQESDQNLYDSKDEMKMEGCHSIDKPFQCPVCKSKYCYRKSLEKHLKTIHPKHKIDVNNIVAQNEYCRSERFKSESGQTDRKQVRIGRRYELSICTICNLEFGNKWSLVWHTRNEHNERSFECYLCGINVNTSSALKYHFRKKHVTIYDYQQDKYRLRKCTTCGEQFHDVCLWAKHKRFHKEQMGRQYKCSICPKAFLERHELRRHIALHSAIKKYKCDMCEKTFASRTGRMVHMYRHTGEKRVQCTDCGNFFTSLRHLTKHMLIHTGEKPHACEFCGKHFRDPYNLSVHRRNHTGEYLYNCKPCEKGFGARRDLRKHNLRYHGADQMENVVLDQK